MDRSFQFKAFLTSYITDSGVIWRQHSDLLDLHQSGVAVVELDQDLVVGHGHVLGVGGDDGPGEEADVGRAPHGADTGAHRQLMHRARPDLQNLRNNKIRTESSKSKFAVMSYVEL